MTSTSSRSEDRVRLEQARGFTFRRPVDRIDQLGIGLMFTRQDAQERGVCCKCGQVPDLWDPLDLAEYGISAMCPTCWEEVE
jgi:hypothetical protein